MARLGQNRINRLAVCVTGDDEGDSFDYRRHVDLTDFFTSVGPPDGWEDSDDSRYTRARKFVADCNRTPTGGSGLPEGIEALVRAMLSLGEFSDETQRDAAMDVVRGIFDGYRVAIGVDDDGDVQVTKAGTDRRQKLIDEEVHTALGAVLHESDFDNAREHYLKAKQLLSRGDPANSIKESVCSVEAFVVTITEERDFKKALRKCGLPRTIETMIAKLYAWRGDEPGVAHGGKVRAEAVDAQFALNMAGVANLYLRDRLTRKRESKAEDDVLLFSLP